MFISNNRASFHLQWKKNLVKRQKVSKYYENDIRRPYFNTRRWQIDLNIDGLIYWLIKRLVFSVLLQNVGESVTFVTLMEHSWYTCFSSHLISGNSLCYCWALIIAKSQHYSSMLFCHIGLEAYISVHSSLILGIQGLFIFAIISSTNHIICVLCLCHIAFPLELDINKYVFGTNSNFDYDQSNSCWFLLFEVKFLAFWDIRRLLHQNFFIC